MIQFDQYTIRQLTTGDLIPYFEMVERNRKRLENFFTGTVSRTMTLPDTETFLEDVINKAKDRIYFPYLLIDNNTNRFIGFLDLKNIDWSIPKSEVGCYMDMDYAGKGVGKKAFHVFCDHCFNKYGFRKLFLRTHESNKAAINLAESAGFEREGIIRRDYKTTSGELVDLIYYGRLN